ncbi:outer membrane protein OmpA-like peptidoglycan-associated protein [Dyadobacter jejuensis]|uniref:Outer membrane protein OmpA-like peptidoglycan-associated protein n=1 Tax=Dyadobacter jejuensis TaxID=1082580 RepID=A0A316BAW8_9BACT|nr:OmpA family protein [Dyadobacter jejuensis]PWJ59687.1 outer membrane protein OmpA-like peptidoglycan-associated protein [Dyadobacter jejuensis]
MKKLTYITYIVLMVCQMAKGQSKSRLPDPINLKDYIEYAPSISADGRKLIFQSGRYGLYVSAGNRVPVIEAEGRTQKMENSEMANFYGVYETSLHPSGQWLTPEPIMNINRYGSGIAPVIGGPSISYDGNFLYYFANYNDDSIGYGREDIYYCQRTKYGWSKPVNLGDAINTPGYEGFPSISPDGKVLYFVRENLAKLAEGEQQCYRIMRSNLGSDGKWQRPIELPAPVNMDCEKAPRIMADGRTLVFSSIKKGGKGDFDLYYSRFEDNGSWSNPVALDMINTKRSDQSVAISTCGDIMYYISNGDIYTYTIPEALRPYKMAAIQGYATDSATGKPLQTRVVLSNRKTAQVVTSVESNPDDGRFTLLAPVTDEYEISISMAQYHAQRQGISFQDYVGCKLIERNFKLKSNRTSGTVTRSDIAILPPTTRIERPAAVVEQKPIQPETTTSEVVFASAPADSTVEKLRAEEKVVVRTQRLETQDTTQVTTPNVVPTPKPTLFRVAIAVRDLETNELLQEVSVKAGNDDKLERLIQNPDTHLFELEVPPHASLQILSAALHYQSMENRLDDITENKTVSIKLLKIKPSIVKISVIDFETNQLIPSEITIGQGDREAQTIATSTGKLERTFDKPVQITITATAQGYTTVSKTIDVEVAPGGKVYDYEARIDRSVYTLSMKVVDIETNQPINKASFAIRSLADTSVLTVATDGATEIPLPKTGKYEVSCTVAGYNPHKMTLTVEQEKTEVLFKVQKTPKIIKQVAVQIVDKYTKEALGAKLTANGQATVSDGSLYFEAGTIPKLEASVAGYPLVQHQLTDSEIDIGQVNIQVIKTEYPFTFRALSLEDKKLLTTARFALIDESKNEVNLTTTEGEVTTLLSPAKSYQLSITCDGYEEWTTRFDPQAALADRQDVLELFLKPVPTKIISEPALASKVASESFGELKKGRTITLNKIYFDQSSPVLRNESFEELNNLVEVLNQNPTLRIEIRGHTDNIGDFDANVKLSKERCESVVKYLVSKGISKKRLQYVGKGPVNPVAPNNNEENKKKNRRVEFVVL